MRRFPQRFALSTVACALLVAAALLAWALATAPSEAQTGLMQDCPPAGMWSIAVWDGESGTAAADALATCGSSAVDAAYSLDAPTGNWWRWFAGKPDVSDLPPLNDMQGVLALGSATGPAATPTPAATATPWPPPNTPPGSVLSEGETWYQDGVALTLVSADLYPSQWYNVVFHQLRLENLTDLDLVVSYGPDSFEVRNNVGDAFDVDTLLDDQSFLLATGETEMLQELRWHGDIESSPVTSVAIRVLSLSRVRDARWSIPVYH